MKRFVYILVSLHLFIFSSSSAAEEKGIQPPERAHVFFGSFGDVWHSFRSGYFNIDCLDPRSDPNNRQIMHVGPYTSGVFELGWGNWSSPEGRQAITDCMVKRLIEAKAHGKRMSLATFDYIFFNDQEYWADRSKAFVYRGHDVVVPELMKAFAQLERNGVLHLLSSGYCYIIDEPSVWGVTADGVRLAVEALRRAAEQFPSLGGSCKSFVIYPPRHYDGVKYLQLAATDDYDAGAGVLEPSYYNQLKSRLRPAGDRDPQWIGTVPGAAFGQELRPFYEKMQEDAQNRLVVSFIASNNWKSYNPGDQYYRRLHASRGKSVGVVGQEQLAREYCHYGKKILEPWVTEPDCSTPPPEVMFTVNGGQHVIAEVGTELFYRWDTRYTHDAQLGRTRYTSYWWSSDPLCSYGLNGGIWGARDARGESRAVVEPGQAGCTYTITFAALGPGQKNRAATISVTIPQMATNPIRRIGRRG